MRIVLRVAAICVIVFIFYHLWPEIQDTISKLEHAVQDLR